MGARVTVVSVILVMRTIYVHTDSCSRLVYQRTPLKSLPGGPGMGIGSLLVGQGTYPTQLESVECMAACMQCVCV